MKTISNPFLDGSIGNKETAASGIGSRAFAMEVIKENYLNIIGLTGKLYQTSTEVLDALHSLGLPYSKDGRKLTKSNAMGDILGKHGLHLPTETISGKKHFFIGAIIMSPQGMKEFGEMSDEKKAARVDQVIEDVKKLLAAAELLAEEEEPLPLRQEGYVDPHAYVHEGLEDEYE